jgi:hypothetical protein
MGVKMAEKIEFHFKGGSADAHQLPVELMINLLNNIRELTYLIVAQGYGIAYNERFNPSRKIRDNYIIKCELPKEGSYEQVISFNYVGDEILFESIKPGNCIKELIGFIIESAELEIYQLFPNAKLRSKALSCIREAFPKPDNNIFLEIIDGKDVTNSRSIQKNLTKIIDRTQAAVEEYMTAVTGRLISIDFDERKIIIIHPTTKRELDCFYNEDIEDMLFENRRQLVQIIGLVTLDDNEHPKKITDVVSIQEIDLSPIYFDEINYGKKKLHFKESLILTPRLDNSEQLYTINYPELGLELFAYTRQEIASDVKSDIIYLWEEYAKAEDNTLTEDAKILKKKLLNAIEEV